MLVIFNRGTIVQGREHMNKQIKMIVVMGLTAFLALFVQRNRAYSAIDGSVTEFEVSALSESLGLKRVHVYTFPKAGDSQKKRYYYKSPDYRYSVEINCASDGRDIWMQSLGAPLAGGQVETQQDKDAILAFAAEVSSRQIDRDEFASFVEAAFMDKSGNLQKTTMSGYRVELFVGHYLSYWAVDIRK